MSISDPALDQRLREQPAKDYCQRLAEEMKAFPPASKLVGVPPEATVEHSKALRAALEESWSKALEDVAEKPKTIADCKVPEIADHLQSKPRLQARMASLIEYPPSKWLLERELAARGHWPPENPGEDVYMLAESLNLKGICFSGGGIRSATFNLGVLQGLSALGKLGSFDYLSTVSGGGYIHQFLASWVSREGLDSVEKQLQPLPGPPSTRTFWPEPLRWLRRYSNYLTPKVGLFTADTWVAFSIWLRNTFLNQIVLISTILIVLLLPHFYLSSNGPVAHFLLRHGGFTALLILLGFGTASALIFFTQLTSPPSDHCHLREEEGFGQTKVLLLIFGPIVLSLLALSPYLYRSAFWSGLRLRESAPQTAPQLRQWSEAKRVVSTVGWPENTGIVPPSTRVYISHLHNLAVAAPVPPTGVSPGTCSQTTRSTFATLIEPCGLASIHAWYRAYSFRWWSPWKHFDDDTSTSYVFFATLLGLALLVFSGIRAIPPGWKQSIVLLGIAGAIGAGYVSINLSRQIIFLSSFFLHQQHVTRIAIPLLPPLGFFIFFVSIEVAGGLVGNLVDESVREWFARLRAWSFLCGIVWFALIAASLLGPALVSWLGHSVYLGKSIGLGWIATTLVSVLAGKSSQTGAPPTQNQPKSSKVLNAIALIGPPVFIAGLVVGLSWVVEKALVAFEAYKGVEFLPHLDFFIPLALLAFIAALFGWRIDINEFSLHAFYRDRLARCYAGASNPDRRANRFTGFAASDKNLRLVDLLPVSFNGVPADLLARDCDGRPKAPTYQGPFPIFCTTLNISFGEDLAYQERKGAAFAFTPLYCGYDLGWTEADTDRIQFNGFTPTRTFAFGDGGPKVATAVATSGSAVSPNMGYHSSPTMAFLLTIFNFRLGLWIRNPRHKQFRMKRLRKNDNPASPWFGLFYLLAELFGQVNDAAAFVYLTDGGHFENMGLYELVRRHCMTIVICDAEQDGKLAFEGLGMAIRKCRIDFGAEIELDVSRLDLTGTPPVSPHRTVQGTIRYPSGAVGHILYIKSAYTVGLPADLVNYHKQHQAFPYDTTLNQWFTESQFESYRRLGQQSVMTGTAATWLNTL
jgi:hypothetical protein